MSVNDRAAYMSAPRPRAVSNRVDAESRGLSPMQIENKNPLRNSSSSHPHRVSRDQKSMSEKRSERPGITTRERSVRRNQTKDSISAPNRGDWEKNRPRKPIQTDGANPSARDGEKTPTALPWNPQASLIPHSTAPLACRVSVPPLASAAPQSLHPRALRELSSDAQEAAILEDLLFVFMGFEGQYVHYANYDPSVEKDRLAGPAFQIAPGLDPTLRDLTQSMLKMATHYSAMEAFVEIQSRAECGAVSHSLCASIRKLLKDYLILIAQLEGQLLNNPTFTLHLLHLHTMPTSQCLAQLYSMGQELLLKNGLLDEEIEESIDDFDEDVDNILEQLKEGGDLVPGSMTRKKMCKGGNILGLLTGRLASFSGDPTTKTLLQTLLRDASRPYMTMLNEWLHHGGIRDPHAEFLVKEQKWIRREKLEEDYTDEYWEKRYTIRENEVPPQLKSVQDKVLLAGKYLNVVRECGGVDVSKEVMDVPQTLDDPRFLDNVNSAYTYANASLLNLLVTKNSLTTRFRSLKHYFFLDRSDFFSYFLELSASELRKPARSVNEGKLQSLLDIVLRQPGSVAALDPFKEDVKVKMNKIGLTKWLMQVVNVSGVNQDGPEAEKQHASGDEDKDIVGFDALELDYQVPFPLSLVISRKTVLRYQLIFRHLLSLRHLETLLVTSWADQNKTTSWRHKSSDRRLEIWKRRAWNLRAKMLVFVQQLLYFCTAEVIEPNWVGLMDRVNSVDADASAVEESDMKPVNRTVDELMQDHVDFLDTCLKECMLTQAKLLKIHSKLVTCCTMFASWTAASLSRALASADPDLATGKVPGADARGYDPSRIGKLEDTLKRYEDHFSRHLRILMDSLNYFAATESVVLLKLAHSLTAISREESKED
ncbi:unnamed protein product [Penicillium olsonii]|uniref:Spindle pole body component n=1 Tax=Penicillium olsonii TaxID=99116 RepID=A0A9W4MR76_PENOL|nr:unnamed protein product [Penicillium olsonii]CAG8070188.1 unnamed protein product [Penicillium olsonii]